MCDSAGNKMVDRDRMGELIMLFHMNSSTHDFTGFIPKSIRTTANLGNMLITSSNGLVFELDGNVVSPHASSGAAVVAVVVAVVVVDDDDDVDVDDDR